MKITQKDQITILFSLDEYIKIIKRNDRKTQIENAMELLENCTNEKPEVDKETLNIYLTSLKFYAYHSSIFWKELCLETYKEIKQNYGENPTKIISARTSGSKQRHNIRGTRLQSKNIVSKKLGIKPKV